MNRFAFAALLAVVSCGAADRTSSNPATGSAAAPSAAVPSTPLASPSAAPPPSEKTMSVDDVAAQLLRSINARDSAAIVATFSGPMREVLPLEKAGPWVAGILDARGKLVSSSREPGRGDGQQHGVYRFKAERGDWQVELHLDKAGKVAGLKLGDPPAPEPEVARSTLAMGLPFHGQWSVFWGGSTPDVNAHIGHKSQRRAVDLVMVGPDKKTHRGDGKKNEDYLAYGQEVLAVADGTVITAIDGVPENVPGAMNPYFALGNIVILQHADKVYSAYAHLQGGKLRVKLGAKVKKAAALGVCGNSGNSSEPHLHFQLQDGPLFESSWGIETVFKDVPVVRDGKPMKVAEYTWLRGDLVGDALTR